MEGEVGTETIMNLCVLIMSSKSVTWVWLSVFHLSWWRKASWGTNSLPLSWTLFHNVEVETVLRIELEKCWQEKWGERSYYNGMNNGCLSFNIKIIPKLWRMFTVSEQLLKIKQTMHFLGWLTPLMWKQLVQFACGLGSWLCTIKHSLDRCCVVSLSQTDVIIYRKT